MRLFLSSENVGKYPDELVRLAGNNKKMAYIGNARDDWVAADSKTKENKHKKQFEDLGFKFESINLKDYFGKPDELAGLLMEFGLIWVSGGNTFILRRVFAYSGLDKILQNMITSDKIAYGGSSAGSIIVTPSLRGSEHGDSPEVTPEGYDKEIIWEGLNIVPFYVVPHYKSDWWGKEADMMVEYLESNNLSYKALEDGQVWLIDGDKEEFLK